ncbi:NAD(P)H-dependent oxidoreductase [Frigoribacterium sp. ACAM 257]|nr:NAD(P)H-dependent oxidoreductase [Frigoribacterium sp. ACAM 257]
MKTMIVTAHPDPESLTSGIAELVRGPRWLLPCGDPDPTV